MRGQPTLVDRSGVEAVQYAWFGIVNNCLENVVTAEPVVAALDHNDSESVSALVAEDGWTGAAIAVHSVLAIQQPMFMRLEAPGYEPLVIDFRFNAFSWATPLAEFPPHPLAIVVETEPTAADEPPLFELPGRNLDALLWAIGLHSFTGQRASWLPLDERYRLTRWPNLTEHAPTIEQIRMTATLANAFLSAEELATATGSDLRDAQRLINALSLLGIVEASTTAPGVVAEPTSEEATASRSFFSRLLEKIGR